MFVKVFGGAVLALSLGAGGALAQSAADIGGPRERPPASFSGQQFVDSRGCVFLRAGLGGTVTWVPRVDANRQAMCGYPPTFGGQARPAAVAKVAAPAAEPAKPAATPAPQRVAGAEPPPESYVPAPVRGVTAPVMAPAPIAAPSRPVMAVEQAGTGRKIACPRVAPVAQRLPLTNGGTVVVCTRGDGTLDGLRAPVYPAGSGVGAALSGAETAAPLGQPAARGDGRPGRVLRSDLAVPAGYKLAWEDDRLNPLRGVGTSAGQAAQDEVWTREVPAQPVMAAKLTVSSKSEARGAVAGATYVQVGSFAQPANATGAAARLAALGLPVARADGRIGGKAVQVVLAGPFGSVAEAQAALQAARGAGFGDAFIR